MSRFSRIFCFFTLFLFYPCFDSFAVDSDSNSPSPTQAISDGPEFKDAFVKGWISNASNSLFEFGHENYTEKFNSNKNFFTTAGFRSFYGAINQTGFLKSVLSKKQTLRGYIISPVQLSEPKIVRSTFFWTASFNYVIEYKSEESLLYQFLKVSVDIKEVSSDKESGGKALAIDRWLSFVDENPVFCACKDPSASEESGNLHDHLEKVMGVKEETETDSQDSEPAQNTEKEDPQEEPSE